MKKTVSVLLAVIMVFGLMTYSGVAYAKSNAGFSAVPMRLDDGAFVSLTPQEQYDYLLTLGTEEEIRACLSRLSGEQIQMLLDALDAGQRAEVEAYLRYDAEPPAPETAERDGAASAPDEAANEAGSPDAENEDQTDGGQNDEAATSGDAAVGDADYSSMTPEQLYAYLCTFDDAEGERVMAALTPEQYAALEAYVQGLATEEQTIPAVSFTHAASLQEPVNIVLPKNARQAVKAMAQSSGGGQEDALILDKTVGGENGSYTLNIEAYATGDVSITTSETPVPADIILVLDISKSMDSNMISETYTPKTYSTNSAVYSDKTDLYVLVDGQYRALTIDRKTRNGQFIYTYSYNGIGTPIESTGANGAPPNLSFYKRSQSQISRISALKSAANSFIDSIQAKANAGAGVDHRIAVVTYSTNAAIISGYGTSNHAFVSARNNTAGINALKTSVSNLRTDMWTRSDLGLQKAADILQNDLPGTAGLRSRVVVFFTDGAPSQSGGGEFQTTIANAAIDSAKTLKATQSAGGYGATVYSVGIFDGANPGTPIGSASDENKFMHFVSSNYPNAVSMSNYGSGSNAGYYLSASSAEGLSGIFRSISQNIETGGTTVTLDANSVIRDDIAPYFKLPDNADAGSIHLYTSAVNASTGQWESRQPFGGSVTISADRRRISVSGFSYKDNYYAEVKNDQGQIVEYRGKKLIIEIPIEYIAHSCLGGLVPTNLGSSGIYDHDTLVEALPIPHVPIPVEYDFAAVNKSVYLNETVRIPDLFTHAQSDFIPDGINNAYVNIVYTVKDDANNLLGTYTVPMGVSYQNGVWDPADPAVTGLKENETYFIHCTVTPNDASISAGSFDRQAHVYVFKPKITYRDSTIFLGETADYSQNFVSAEWQNGEAGVPAPSGPAPELSIRYSPEAGAFAADTYVNAAVSLNGENVTAYTAFAHEPTEGSAFDPLQGEFIVFVKSCSLTVSKAGAADETDTFIFTVRNGSGLNIAVSLQGNGSRTIVGLPIGEYTVTEAAGWSWRYSAGVQSVTLSRSNPNAAVTIGNTLTNDKWLAGDAWCANLFSGSH